MSARTVPGTLRRELMSVENLETGNEYSNDGREVVAEIDQAHVVNSRLAAWSHQHAPVLDIDFAAELVPSSTPGHFHLYLDTLMSWDQYVELLTVMEKVGILQPGYVAASIERGYTSVRLPWVTKPAPADVADGGPF